MAHDPDFSNVEFRFGQSGLCLCQTGDLTVEGFPQACPPFDDIKYYIPPVETPVAKERLGSLDLQSIVAWTTFNVL